MKLYLLCSLAILNVLTLKMNIYNVAYVDILNHFTLFRLQSFERGYLQNNHIFGDFNGSEKLIKIACSINVTVD